MGGLRALGKLLYLVLPRDTLQTQHLFFGTLSDVSVNEAGGANGALGHQSEEEGHSIPRQRNEATAPDETSLTASLPLGSLILLS